MSDSFPKNEQALSTLKMSERSHRHLLLFGKGHEGKLLGVLQLANRAQLRTSPQYVDTPLFLCAYY